VDAEGSSGVLFLLAFSFAAGLGRAFGFATAFLSLGHRYSPM
jgi:hypothetical protein